MTSNQAFAFGALLGISIMLRQIEDAIRSIDIPSQLPQRCTIHWEGSAMEGTAQMRTDWIIPCNTQGGPTEITYKGKIETPTHNLEAE